MFNKMTLQLTIFRPFVNPPCHGLRRAFPPLHKAGKTVSLILYVVPFKLKCSSHSIRGRYRRKAGDGVVAKNEHGAYQSDMLLIHAYS
jgi:hypothetical protein